MWHFIYLYLSLFSLLCICTSVSLTLVKLSICQIKLHILIEKIFFNFWFFSCQSKDGQPLLLVAAEAGLDNIVAALLIAGADPNGVHAVCNVKEIYPYQVVGGTMPYSYSVMVGLLDSKWSTALFEPYPPVGLELCCKNEFCFCSAKWMKYTGLIPVMSRNSSSPF